MAHMRRIWTIPGAAAVALAAAIPATAQVPLAPQALGMGGAYIATSRGFESVLFNPANLALSDGPDWSAALPQITVGSSVLGPSVSDLPDYINFDEQDESRRQELLDLIPESGTSADLVLRAPVAAIQVGTLGFSASYAWLGEHTVSKDLVELFFEGWDGQRTDFDLQNTVGTRASFWDIAAGYARAIGPVSVGVTGHYYTNATLMRSRAFFDPDRDIGLLGRTIQVHYTGVYSRGGSGWGLDVGAAIQPMPGLTLSTAVANIAGGFNWSKELHGREVRLTQDDFENGDFMSIEDRWQFSEEEIGKDPSGRYGEVAAGLDPDSWNLPAVFKLGAAWEPIPGTEIGAAFHTSKAEEGEGRLAGRWDGLLGLGVQQDLGFITLRAGASSNLDAGSMLGGGIKLGVLDLAVARFSTPAALEDATRNGWAASMSVNVRTRGTLR